MIEAPEKLKELLALALMKEAIKAVEFRRGTKMFEVQADPHYRGKFRLLYNGAVVESNLTHKEAVRKSNETDEDDEYFKDPLEWEAKRVGFVGMDPIEEEDGDDEMDRFDEEGSDEDM